MATILAVLSSLWSSSIGRSVIIATISLVFGLYQGISFQQNRISALKKQCAAEIETRIRTRDAVWTATLAAANAELDRAVEAAREAAVQAGKYNGDDLKGLCSRNPDCREHGVR
jgi:hypothetical protein